jgi:LacI family transcriptional regulator
MRTKIADIARETGLREGTISRALSPEGKYYVSPATRARVEEAASKLGYRPNYVGRALAAGSSGLLCLLSPLPHSSHYTGLARRLAELANRDGYCLVSDSSLIPTSDRATSPRQEWLYGVDGIIACDPAPWHEGYLAEARRIRIPVVNIGSSVLDGADAVVVDVLTPACHLVRHLIEQGCRNIAMVIPGPFGVSGPLVSAYRAEVRQEGLPELFLHAKDYGYAAGHEAIAKALDAEYDALFCANDELALGIYRGLIEQGRKVPADVALASSDGTEGAIFNQTPLTTLKHPLEEAATAAWNLLKDRLEGRDRPTQVLRFSADLEIRASTTRSTDVKAPAKVARKEDRQRGKLRLWSPTAAGR